MSSHSAAAGDAGWPENRYNDGRFRNPAGYFHTMSLAHTLSLIDIQARMSLKCEASRYFLGYLWWLLEPILYVMVFYLVFGVLLDSQGMEFIVFLMCGKLPFVWFSKTVIKASGSILDHVGLIGLTDLPKAMFPLMVAHEGLYKQVAVFALLAVVTLGAGYQPTLAWLWLFPLVAANYLMIVAISLAAAFMVPLFRDLVMMITLGMTLLLFVSGVFWDPRALDPAVMELIFIINPLAFFLDAYRQVMMHGLAPDLPHLLALTALFGVLFAVMLCLLHRYSRFLALRALTA